MTELLYIVGIGTYSVNVGLAISHKNWSAACGWICCVFLLAAYIVK